MMSSGVHGTGVNSRGLGPGGVLPELAVMNCEIGTKIAAELQRTDGAEETHKTQKLFADWLPATHVRTYLLNMFPLCFSPSDTS